MVNYKNFSPSKYLIVGLILSSLFLFESSAFAQSDSIRAELAGGDLSAPFKLCFDKQIDKSLPASFASDNASALFIAYQTGKLEKVNLEKKSTTWISDLGGEIASDLIFENNRIYFITKISGGDLVKANKAYDGKKPITNYFLWSVDAATGVTVWQFPFSTSGSVLLSEFQDKLFMTIDDGTIIIVRKYDAQKILDKQTGVRFKSAPSFSENKISLATDDNSIIIISAENGEVVSKISTLQSTATTIITDRDKLYWGEKEGFVSFGKISGKSRLWSVRYGGEIYSLILLPNGILVSSLDNFLYLISLQKGKKIWKRRLSGRISAKPLIMGNFVVFSTTVDNNVTIVDSRDGKIVNQIPFQEKGFVLSTPLFIYHHLVFLTTKGIFAFAGTNLKCSPD